MFKRPAKSRCRISHGGAQEFLAACRFGAGPPVIVSAEHVARRNA
jgi:hypothetical protein